MDPVPVFLDLSRRFQAPFPEFLLGQRMPANTLATTDSNDLHIEFGSSDPDLDTIAHEFFHVLHLTYGFCPRGDCEEIAPHFAAWYATGDRATFPCEKCAYPIPQADDWTMCFRCGLKYYDIDSAKGAELMASDQGLPCATCPSFD